MEEVTPAPECVLLVVDVQNDYCHDGGVFGRAGFSLGAIQAAVERIGACVVVARRVGYFGRVLDTASLEGYWTTPGAR